jgi:hypothetical protein
MDEINHIKYLRDRKGQSLREIARETGHAFETVKNMPKNKISTSLAASKGEKVSSIPTRQ